MIKGELRVNEDYWFNVGSEIYMYTDASIIVENNKTLTLTNRAKVKSCPISDMWDRIEVKGGSRLDLVGVDPGVSTPGVVIQDGKKGVQLNGNATLTIKNTTFLNNDRSITTPDDFTLRHFDFAIEGMNYITSDGNMKPPFAGKLPYAGMRLHELNGVSIMGSPGNTIEFSNLARGIVLYRSNATIGRLLFKDIKDDPNNTSKNEGVAIRAAGLGANRTLRYIGFDNSSVNDFRGCVLGILADDNRLDVTGVKMTEVSRGIEVQRNIGRFVRIHDNTINARTTGIGLFQNMPVMLDISENTVNIHNDLDPYNSSKGRGIRGEETIAAPISTSYRIWNNLVNVDNAQTGIWFQSGTAPSLRNNTVDLLDEDRETYFGFDLQGIFWPIVRCNLVNGNSGTSFKSAVGIYSLGNSMARFRCNEVADTDVGIRFMGMGDDTELRGSIINDHRLGVLVEAGGFIGDQIHFGNEWLGTTTYGGAGNSYQPINGRHGAFNGGNPFLSQFFVDQTENALFNTSVNVNNWFFNQNLPDPSFYCVTQTMNTCPTGTGSNINEFADENPPSLDVLDYEIAKDSIPHEDCRDAVNWTAQRHLYRRLMMEPSLYASDTIMQNFVTAASQGTVGQFHEIEENIIGLFSLDTLTDAQIDTLEADIELVREEIFVFDQALRDSISTQEADSIKTLRATRLASLSDFTADSDSLWTLIRSNRISAAQTVITKNANINAVDQHEINEQTVNDIFLKTVAVGVDTFTSQQAYDLRAVALQCPDCGGDAVYRARSIFALLDPAMVFDDNTLCSGIGSRSARMVEETSVSDFLVYPNPASNELTLLVEENSKNAPAEISICSITGVELMRYVMPENETKYVIDISQFPAGIYFLKVLEDKKRVHTQKFLIVK